jgi:hypothetical protein
VKATLNLELRSRGKAPRYDKDSEINRRIAEGQQTSSLCRRSARIGLFLLRIVAIQLDKIDQHDPV